VSARLRRAAAAAVAGLVVIACAGPRPSVESYELRAGGPGTIVSVVVVNAGGGEGQAEVEVTLRAEGRVVARDERTVALRAHERVTVLVPVATPYLAALRADVRARYPVD
jgi:hypothetical protein